MPAVLATVTSRRKTNFSLKKLECFFFADNVERYVLMVELSQIERRFLPVSRQEKIAYVYNFAKSLNKSLTYFRTKNSNGGGVHSCHCRFIRKIFQGPQLGHLSS